MAIITISKGILKRGTDVAEKVAELLGYGCLDRQFLVEASKQFDIPEVKLSRTLDDTPGFIDRLTFAKDKYIAYIRKALLEQLAGDNIVYHGIAGQFFVENVDHVLKVRVIGTLETRIHDVKEQDNISEKEALQVIKGVDDARRKWSRFFYGIEIEDPGLYDLVININHLTVETAAELIATAAQLPRFQTTPESKIQFDDLFLVAKVRALIIKSFPNATITAKEGVVTVTHVGTFTQEASYDVRVQEALKDVEGIKKLVTRFLPVSESHYGTPV